MTALEVATTQIGVTEYPAGSNNVKYNTWYYGREVSGSDYPWCMTFVQDCFYEAGTPLPYKTASCTALLNWYRTHDPGCIVKTPQKGDITIMCFGAGRYHVGILSGYNASANLISAIEGNTSLSSDDNGGAVMRRTRSTSVVTAYIRPRAPLYSTGGGNNTMDIVKGSTASETNMIKKIQEAVNAVPDGEIGTQTMSDIACQVNADCFPVTLKIYNAPVIIARDIIPFSAGGSKLSDYKNTINGSFYANGRPCSILIQDGIVIQKDACHASYGKPESVIYKTFTSGVGIMRVRNVSELPKGLLWAVGGVGLLNNYDPAAEGFCKLGKEDFSDVLRKTNHSMLGYKNGFCYLVYCANMTAAEVNALAKKFCFRVAIMLDGGHVAGINGAETFAMINTAEKQYYMIQGVR